ncbi:recombinase family protein [Streptomyces sp. NPDC050355]|uniref:recombinase family protein n=1 Tax=Streptomyces sp. NPDC050355 TaxID=3365609 RepID=UPI0037B902E5
MLTHYCSIDELVVEVVDELVDGVVDGVVDGDVREADKAQSGTIAGDEGPELAAALLWVEEKKAQGIVAPNLDRLARELVVQEAALAQTWKHSGRAFMADQGEILPDDPEDPMRTTMRQTMGVFAQLDRGMTVAKLRRGRRIKGEKGQYAYGAPPYGWTAHKKDLTTGKIISPVTSSYGTTLSPARSDPR